MLYCHQLDFLAPYIFNIGMFYRPLFVFYPLGDKRASRSPDGNWKPITVAHGNPVTPEE